MKRLFKIVLIVCPIVNLILLVLLSIQSSSGNEKAISKQEAVSKTTEEFQATNGSSQEQQNEFTTVKMHSAKRFYFVNDRE